MQVFSALLETLGQIKLGEPALDAPRLKHLDAWFKKGNVEKFIELYYRLEDEDSLQVFLKLLKNSIGTLMDAHPDSYKFYSDQEWDKFVKQVDSLDYTADSYQLDLVETFILEGYSYKNVYRARPGDIVLDCGAYTGNTAIYFSRCVGKDGLVYAFEAMPKTFAKLSASVAKYGAGNIIVLNQAISEKSGTLIFTKDDKPWSRVTQNVGGIEVKGVAIDDFVKENHIPKVSFIKMDIEGSEEAAIRGAAQTLAKFRPILAISLYHKPDDFIVIPGALLAIDPTYRFYMRHCSPGFAETVLFAVPSEAPQQVADCHQEAQATCDLWRVIRGLWLSRQKELRRRLLECYNLELKRMGFDLTAPAFDHRDWRFMWYPVGAVREIHYEFLLWGSVVDVALHFEGQHAAKAEGIRDICERSHLATPLKPLGGTIKGYSYMINDPFDVSHVAKVMKYLMELSLPALASMRLLDDNAAMKVENQVFDAVKTVRHEKFGYLLI